MLDHLELKQWQKVNLDQALQQISNKKIIIGKILGAFKVMEEETSQNIVKKPKRNNQFMLKVKQAQKEQEDQNQFLILKVLKPLLKVPKDHSE